jgi:hypothetical protein
MRKFLILLVFAILSISCGGESENGVARAEDAEPVPAKVDTIQQVSQSPVDTASGTTGSDTGSAAPTAASISQAAITKTDEDLTSEFAACLRNQGFDVPDPEVTADGSVDLRGFFTALNQDPNFDRQDPKTREALGKCRGLLADASFGQSRSTEDEIELQDQILSFAACLREQNVPVVDPDFSEGTRSAQRTMFAGQDIDREDPDVAKAIADCREGSFTSGMRGNGGNRR